MSSIPSPLHSPRTKPLATNARNPGYAISRWLSVHSGLHGRITRSTPTTAQTNPNVSVVIRCSQSRRPHSGFLREALAAFPLPSQKHCCSPGKAASPPMGRVELFGVCSDPPSPCAPDERQRCGPGFANAHSQRKRIKTHPDILRLQGLNALGHIPVIDVAAIHFHKVV